MKSRISALVDGELDAVELQALLAALQEDGEARESWRTYHLISDALQGHALLSADCARRVASRLAQEPALIAPHPAPIRARARAPWFRPSALVASLMAVGLVGWLAFVPQQGAGPVPAPLAQAPLPPRTERVVVLEPVRVPLTSAARDYLLAHQAFSPRNALLGMAPYVRSVSGETTARKP